MIDYQQYCQIKDYHEQRQLTVPQIARELHLDERTVARWLAAGKFQPRRVAPRSSKLDPYKPQVVRWLEVTLHRRAGLPAAARAATPAGSPRQRIRPPIRPPQRRPS
jgi:hypothetical protein